MNAELSALDDVYQIMKFSLGLLSHAEPMRLIALQAVY